MLYTAAEGGGGSDSERTRNEGGRGVGEVDLGIGEEGGGPGRGVGGFLCESSLLRTNHSTLQRGMLLLRLRFSFLWLELRRLPQILLVLVRRTIN